jgi:hypothetical protein
MNKTGEFKGNLSKKLHIIKKANKTIKSDMRSLRSRIFFIQGKDIKTWKRITTTKNLATKVLSVKKEKDLRTTNAIYNFWQINFLESL